MSGEKAFDFVIAGAGSAGCVLASRLSEDSDASVCLIEAGPRDRHPLIHIPMGFVALLHHKTLNWRFSTVPQASASNNAVYMPRGRTLGGTSSINAMVYMRGHPLDFDDWANAGNPSWSYRDVLPYFRKSENNENFPDSAYHGTGGPLNVMSPKHPNPMDEALLNSIESLQYQRREDFNDADQEGFGYHQLTQKNGRRHSTARAFLDPARGRPNLTIVTAGHVNRVVFEGRRAAAVEIVRGAGFEKISARREIILSAGALGSPGILQRSGVGNGDDLKRLGIGVVHDLPGVGRNLQDHMGLGIQVESRDTRFYGISVRALPRLAWGGIEYMMLRTGMLASNVVEVGGFLRTDPALDRPDIQHSFIPARSGKSQRLVGYGHGFMLVTILARPKSRGTVGLSAADPVAPPAIDLGAFTEPEDMATFLKGYTNSRRFLRTPEMTPFVGKELVPGPGVTTDAELEAFVRVNGRTVYHPVGTCKMGNDANAVVDAELRVRGIEGLRVVDASIMPTIVGGNTNAPTIMIGEKAADMIRGRAPLPAETPNPTASRAFLR